MSDIGTSGALSLPVPNQALQSIDRDVRLTATAYDPDLGEPVPHHNEYPFASYGEGRIRLTARRVRHGEALDDAFGGEALQEGPDESIRSCRFVVGH
jgi:hypothetical protein